MAVLRLFASAREAAGVNSTEIAATTVGEVLDEACRRYGDRFTAVLASSKVWVNGEPASPATPVGGPDVVAVLPPVSGGADVPPAARPHATPAVVVRGNLALVPEPAPAPRAEPERPPLAVVHRSVRPHGRLGVAWAVVTFGVTVAGPAYLAAWLAVAAFFAGAQACQVWRKRGERPISLVAAAMAAAMPVAASFDVTYVAGVVAAGVASAFTIRVRNTTRAPSRDVALTLVIGTAVGLAAAAPVLVRHTGISAALLLLVMVFAYDAGAYLVGTGASSAWEGPAAGVVALLPITIFAEILLVPPFAGAQPLFLGVLAAVLAPAGPVAASALLGDRSAHAPALRRLDSLLLLGPLWAWCAVAFLR